MSDGPDLLERVRMCLAESGFGPEFSRQGSGSTVIDIRSEVPDPIAWRAVRIAKIGTADDPMTCFACAVLESRGGVSADCMSRLPLTEDCGVDR